MLLITLFGTLAKGVYFWDLFSDIDFARTLRENCHDKYFIFSISVIIASYMMTAFMLYFQLKQSLMYAIFHPAINWYIYFRFSKGISFSKSSCRWNFLKRIQVVLFSVLKKEAVPEEDEDDKVLEHKVAFIEASSESVLQLCISCRILREFGLSTETKIMISQITTFAMSIFSLCFALAKVSTR